MSEFEMFCIFVSKGYRIYSEYSSLLFLMLNTFEMSSIIHANKYCKTTSFTPLPPIPVLPEDPVAVEKKTGWLLF